MLLKTRSYPEMEKFELAENIPQKKFSRNQYNEILRALAQPNRIRLATYNVLFPWNDQYYDEADRWSQRFPRLVELLGDLQADIIDVQELTKEQLADLWPYVSGTYSFYCKSDLQGELNGIFYRKDRFNILESKVLCMPTAPNEVVITMLKLEDRKSGKCLAIFNTHLAYKNIDKREAQAAFIAEQIASVASLHPVILTGDLNTFPSRLDLGGLPFYDGDFIHRILTQGPLRDAREKSLLGHLGPIATFTNRPGDGKAFQGTGTPGVFLDHIYATSDVTILLHAVQPGTVGGHFPSDHMPVLVDFVLPDR